MERELTDFNFEELVDYVTQRVHLSLIEGGGKEMRAEIHLWLRQAIWWDKNKKEKK